MSTGREITYMEAGRGMVWSEHFTDESELHEALVDAAGKCETERLAALLPHVTHAKRTILDNAIEHAAEAGHWIVHRLLRDRIDTLNANAWNVAATAVRGMR
jgi:hypothetical protein